MSPGLVRTDRFWSFIVLSLIAHGVFVSSSDWWAPEPAAVERPNFIDYEEPEWQSPRMIDERPWSELEVATVSKKARELLTAICADLEVHAEGRELADDLTLLAVKTTG